MLYLELDDLLAIACEVLEIEADALVRITDLGLADSAVSRPHASYGGEEFYPAPLPRPPVATITEVLERQRCERVVIRSGKRCADHIRRLLQDGQEEELEHLLLVDTIR